MTGYIVLAWTVLEFEHPGPSRYHAALLEFLQVAIDAVHAFLSGIGLAFTASTMEALLFHPRASARRSTPRLSLRGVSID
ncbi:hypothetical protein MRX96_045622 [Rhipicephalus microplus]